MLWQNISKNQCPKCSRMLNPDYLGMGMVICGGICDFKISYGKFMDLSKGKDSDVYKATVKKNKSISRYKHDVNVKYKMASMAQQLERESNLRRMTRKLGNTVNDC